MIKNIFIPGMGCNEDRFEPDKNTLLNAGLDNLHYFGQHEDLFNCYTKKQFINKVEYMINDISQGQP